MFVIIITIIIIIHVVNSYTFLKIQQGYRLFWRSFPTAPLSPKFPALPSLTVQSNLLFASLPSPLNCELIKGKDCALFISKH